ncbi:MAG: redoxin domain-containing protein [Bacteroidota bacterium]
MAVAVGQKAPNFTLADAYRKPVSLSDYAGKKVVIFFYPGAFTAVCEKEMCTIRDAMADFNSGGAQVLGISVDAPAANKAFADKNGLKFPLLSDFTRYISAQYCGLVTNFGGLIGLTAANRAAYVVDGNGMVSYAWVSENPGVEPPYDEVKKAL